MVDSIEHQFKGKYKKITKLVILIGDAGVGKTCLRSRYILD